jgi:hypothetical protein
VQVRIARHTERLDDAVAFYRDGIGLTQVGEFRDHGGYDWAAHGLMFEDPDGFRVVLVPERWPG